MPNANQQVNRKKKQTNKNELYVCCQVDDYSTIY